MDRLVVVGVRISALLVSATLLSALCGCSGDGPPESKNTASAKARTSSGAPTLTASPSHSEARWPGTYSCKVWRLGDTLPADYDGTCTEVNDAIDRSGVVACVGGSAYSTYDNQFYGVLGGPIQAGPDDLDGKEDADLREAYHRLTRACLNG